MEPARVLLDTDVIINWLIQETETTSNKELWKAPHRIIKLIEEKDISGFISLTTLLEIRFLLRRKKKYSFQQIEDDIRKLTTVFDVIHLVVSITSSPIILLSRDKDFLRISKQFVKAITPEEFLKENFL